MVGQMCCAINCNERFKKGGISFHAFPKDPVKRKIWTNNVKRESFIPNDFTKLCAKHFEKDCFNHEKFGGRWLKSTAIPTIFDFHSHLTKTTLRKPPKKRLSPSESVMDETNSFIPKSRRKRKILIADFKPEEDHGKFGGKGLKTTATPIIIDFTPHLKTKTTSRKPPTKRLSPSESVMHKTNSLHEQFESEVSEKAVLPKKKRLSYLGDFKGDCSPTELKKQCEIAKSIIEKQKKKILVMRRKERRLVKKVADLSSMLKELKEKYLISKKAKETLEQSNSGIAGEIFWRSSKTDSGNKYSPEVRKFAMNLYCHSSKAYKYVRTVFKTGLPHPATLRKWYGGEESSPDLTKEALETKAAVAALETTVADAKENNEEVLCALIMNEMSMGKHVEGTGTMLSGNIDMETDIFVEQLPVVTEVEL